MNSKSFGDYNKMKLDFFSILALVFITLKLTGFITWSWWYVTMPLWGGIAFVFGLWGIAFVGALLVSILVVITKKYYQSNNPK
jgi:hypothetical protein